MMTKIKSTVSRETFSTIYERGKAREVIVSIESPGVIRFRLKGCRKSYVLPADALFWIAMKAEVLAAKRIKSLEKARKAKGRRKRGK